MPTDHIVELLIAERDKLNRAIEALGGGGKRRGRPPGSGPKHVAAATEAAPTVRKRRNFSPAAREAARKRMKAFWAKRKKLAKKAN